METTYGVPRYRFPPVRETLLALVKFCVETLEEGDTPVLLGYSLGKAQEVLSALQGAGFPIMLHAAVARIAKVYEEFGIAFPPYTHFEPAAAAGHVLIGPPSINGSRMLRSLHHPRLAAITGWAMDPGAARRFQVDVAFPFQIMRITMICSAMSKSCVPIACSPFTDSRRNSRATFASEGSRRGP